MREYPITDPLLTALREARPEIDDDERTGDAHRLLATILREDRTVRPAIDLAPRTRRPAARRTALFLAAAAAVLALALVVPTIGGSGAPHRGTAKSPLGPGGFQLVDSSTFPFRTVGGGPDSIELDCVTETVCYAATNGENPGLPFNALVKTTDGGATWKSTAPVPGLTQWPIDSMSCPTALVCFVGSTFDTAVAVTADGGDHWRTVQVGPPGSTVGQLDCADALHCATWVNGQLVHTEDGGHHFTTTPPAPGSAVQPWAFTCSSGGSCIAIEFPPSTPNALVTLRTDDWGATWTETPAPASLHPGMGIILATCGDASHCLAAYPAVGTGALTLASTADGGASWRVSPAPAGWPDMGIAVTCATGLDCWVSASHSTRSGGYDRPAIEQTTDGGLTWTTLSVPGSVNGVGMGVVGPLSCPSQAGCIGLGITQDAYQLPVWPPPWEPASRFIISNFPGAATQPPHNSSPGSALPPAFAHALDAPGVTRAAMKVTTTGPVMAALANAGLSGSLRRIPGSGLPPTCNCPTNLLAVAGSVHVPGSAKSYSWAVWMFDPMNGRPMGVVGSDDGTWPAFFDTLKGAKVNPHTSRSD